jgi:hypothetical protein
MNDRKIPVEYPSQKGFANVICLLATDPLGSYTGRPIDPQDEPVQDVDDL